MKRILIVDDDADILEAVGMLLELEGFIVATVARAEDVLGAVEASMPHVVLHDVSMPGLDIGKSVRGIKALGAQNAPAVLLFSAMPDVDQLAAAVGADDAVRKPLELSALLAVLGAS